MVIHVKNLEAIDLARENGVVMMCFPPHCTHKLQPLDVGFMKPLSHNYTEEINTFQRHGDKVTLKNLFFLFGKAFIRAAKMETAINAFRKCGIHPFNASIFSASDFATSTEIENCHSTSSTLSNTGIQSLFIISKLKYFFYNFINIFLAFL